MAVLQLAFLLYRSNNIQYLKQHQLGQLFDSMSLVTNALNSLASDNRALLAQMNISLLLSSVSTIAVV